MRFFTNPFRFINRLRHAFGFGVHSPFAFDLILDTIHCPHSYYNYAENRIKLDRAGLLKQTNLKYAELLFRLANRFNSKNILEIGSGCGINTLYISAYSQHLNLVCIEKSDEKAKAAKLLLANKISNITFSKELPKDMNKYDAIFWNLILYPLQVDDFVNKVQNNLQEEGFIVLQHINTNEHNRRVWQEVNEMESLSMSFDLGSIGIGFFKSGLPKLNYDVYF